ncbi:MAG: hypothetical protein K6G52_03415 [Treponemataceae bacterium]|nr:hypothetical protein [Treponemataceae bacterium]
MKKTAKRFCLVLLLSFVVACIGMSISYFVINDSTGLPATLILGFFFFICSQILTYKFVNLFYDRFVYEQKDKDKSFTITKTSDGIDSIELSKNLSLKFDLSENAIFDIIPLDFTKNLFYVCEVENRRVGSEIVKKIVQSTFDAVGDNTDLKKNMEYLDKSIFLLNMKGVRISVIAGIIDNTEMNLSFINGSDYDIFIHPKKTLVTDSVPLISNKYEMAAEKQLPFIETNYPLKNDDVIEVITRRGLEI